MFRDLSEIVSTKSWIRSRKRLQAYLITLVSFKCYGYSDHQLCRHHHHPRYLDPFDIILQVFENNSNVIYPHTKQSLTRQIPPVNPHGGAGKGGAEKGWGGGG